MALVSSIFVAFISILAKIDIENVNSHLALQLELGFYNKCSRRYDRYK